MLLLLYLALWSFVAAQVLLGLSEDHVFAELLAVLAQAELLRGVLKILGGVVNALTRFFAYQTDNLALFAFFSHKLLFRYLLYNQFLSILTDKPQIVNYNSLKLMVKM